MLFRKLSERLNEILKTLADQWDDLIAALQKIISDMRAGASSDDAGLPDMPEHYVPFLRMLLEAVVGTERPSDEQLLKIRDLTVELVDMIAGELTDTFWEPHKRPAQDALGARIFRTLRTSRLIAPGDVSALKDRLLELARANHERLAVEQGGGLPVANGSSAGRRQGARPRLPMGLVRQGRLTGTGGHRAPSLLFPMEAVFEAFVAKHLARQLARPLILKTQARSHHLVRHREQNWFRLKPDLLIRDAGRDSLVLDTKWKLLDGLKANGTDKYGLSQTDFYQLQAYGQSYLDGQGDVVLIYPKTAAFDQPLPVFEFPKLDGLRLWVLPFCLKSRQLRCPSGAPFADVFAVPEAVPAVAHAISEPISHPITTSLLEPPSVARAQPGAT